MADSENDEEKKAEGVKRRRVTVPVKSRGPLQTAGLGFNAVPDLRHAPQPPPASAHSPSLGAITAPALQEYGEGERKTGPGALSMVAQGRKHPLKVSRD